MDDLGRTGDWRWAGDVVSEPVNELVDTDDAEEVLDYCEQFEIPAVSTSNGYIVRYLDIIHNRCQGRLRDAMRNRVHHAALRPELQSRIINPDYPLWHARCYGELCYGNHCLDERCDFCNRYSWVDNYRPHVLIHGYAEIEGGFAVVVCHNCFDAFQDGLPRVDRFGIAWLRGDNEHGDIVVAPGPVNEPADGGE